MRVSVKLFAGLRQWAGQQSLTVELPEGATIAHLRRAMAEACPGLEAMLPHVLFAIGAQYVTDEATIGPEAEVACIPPVSGG